MKLRSGKRLGQSEYELALAVFFSFFLHVLVVVAALYLYVTVAPKAIVPPFYEVKLVALPAEVAPLPQTAPAAPPKEMPKPEAPPKPKTEKAHAKAKRAAPKAAKAGPKKGAMPELGGEKQKSVESEQAKPEAAPAAAPAKTENVAVTAPQDDFKFAYYLTQVREKISQYWRPPPDAKDAKVRIIFSINRSGWVSPGDVNIDEKNSTGTYGFKLAGVRAILSAKPFPQLPEEFPKQTLELSVDLIAE